MTDAPIHWSLTDNPGPAAHRFIMLLNIAFSFSDDEIERDARTRGATRASIAPATRSMTAAGVNDICSSIADISAP